MNLKQIVAAATGIAALGCAEPRTPEPTLEAPSSAFIDCTDMETASYEELVRNTEVDRSSSNIRERRTEPPTRYQRKECVDFSSLTQRRSEMNGSYRLSKHVREKPYGVLRDTEMPSSLLELLKLNDANEVQNLLEENNLNRLAGEVAKGVLYHKIHHQPRLEKVIIDDGHGAPEVDEGSSSWVDGERVTEAYFTHEFQDLLVAKLDSLGFRTTTLEGYNRDRQDPDKILPDARIDFYTRRANTIGSPDNSIYLSIHADNRPRDDYGFMTFYWRDRQSEELAKAIFSAVSSNFWEEEFPKWAENNLPEPREHSAARFEVSASPK